ncbi:hypothetical protein EDE15_0661 [Edaphobacter aggregans]|uniref:Uncharacterized protein n=1 Tax=Edaphobacter aggregans TaxID=570835 RepID=A0A428ME74_9BACT|nr:hypothetical protein EDE15_0661 [Edaphobacter aggregans]
MTEPKRYQCRHIFTDGHSCGSPCLRHEDFCYYHHTTRRRPLRNPSHTHRRHHHRPRTRPPRPSIRVRPGHRRWPSQEHHAPTPRPVRPRQTHPRTQTPNPPHPTSHSRKPTNSIGVIGANRCYAFSPSIRVYPCKSAVALPGATSSTRKEDLRNHKINLWQSRLSKGRSPR